MARGDTPTLSLSDTYLCGFVAGTANTAISAPVEHIRIRMQVQTNAAGEAATYASTPDCLRQVARQYGIRGVYRGGVTSLVRESVGYGAWDSPPALCTSPFHVWLIWPIA